MKKLKKVISLVLAIIMLLNMSSGISIIAHAENETSAKNDYEFVYNSNGTITLTKYIGKSNVIVIPDEIDGINVTEIGEFVFKDCKNITNITFSENIENFYFNAFQGCTNLVKLSVDKNNSIFDSRDNCNAIINTKTDKLTLGIKTTVIPDSITTIGASAFKYTDCPEELVIPNNVTLLGNQAFYGCKNLKKLKLSDSIGEHGLHWEVFEGCSNLKSVILSNSLNGIGQRLFKDCSSLESIVLPKSIENWQADVFEGCKNIKSITILNKDLNLYRTEEDSPEKWGETPNSIPKNAVIYGFANSTAQEYAEKYGRKFIAIDEPIISDKTNVIYNAGIKKDIVIHSVLPVADFISLSVDGKTVDSKNYTLEEGSTVLTFKPAYLDTLSVGKHTVVMEYANNKISTELTIQKPSETDKSSNPSNQQTFSDGKNDSKKSPSTGISEISVAFIIAVLFTAVGSITVIFKKNKHKA